MLRHFTNVVFVEQTPNFAKLNFERSADRADPPKTTKMDGTCFEVPPPPLFTYMTKDS